MVKTSWIYSLRKEELITYLEHFQINAEGTVAELRKRFISFCAKATEEENKYLEELALKHAPGTSANVTTREPEKDDEESDNEFSIAEEPKDLPAPSYKESTPRSTTIKMNTTDAETQFHDKISITAIDKIRKWGVKYDGRKGPLPFVERVEELAEAYNIPIDVLPRAMPELLKDKAITWYRSNNKRWKSWVQFKEDFLRFFLPARYFENLEDTIRQRMQQARESFRDYVLDLQELMRHSSYTDEQKLHRVYRNCRQEYQLHIKRKEFENLDELMLLAGDYEAIKQSTTAETNSHSRPHVERSRLYHAENNITPDKANTTNIDTRNACRRCGQVGHFARGCRNQQRLFCWTCGKLNTRTMDCCGPISGNADRAHGAQGAVSQKNPTPPTQ